MKIPKGHTLVVNPYHKEENNMTFHKGHLGFRRNPGAKDLAMTALEGVGIGLIAAGVNYGAQKLAAQPADATKKPMLRGRAVGLSQVAVGVVAGAAIDQFAGRRDVAVGVAASLSGLGIRDEWARMQAQKAADAAASAAANNHTAPTTGFSRGLPAGTMGAGATVPANPFAAYYR